MKNRAMRLGVGALALAALMVGCARHHHGQGGPGGERGPHFNPLVSVKAGVISVSPEPLVFAKGERGTITWRAAPGYTFVRQNGIKIDGELFDPEAKDTRAPLRPDVLKYGRSLKEQKEIVDCKADERATSFTCENLNTRRGVFRYTINLRDDKGNVITWDPTVMND